MKLNKNPENFTRDVEQAAFSPGSMVPGVEDGPDPLLQLRPDVAEAPYVVSDNVVSRKSHYWHEGKMNDYAQATALWTKVMTTQ